MAVNDNMGKNLMDLCLVERKLTPDSDGKIYADDAWKTGVYNLPEGYTYSWGDSDIVNLEPFDQANATIITLGNIQIGFDGSDLIIRRLGGAWKFL